MKKSWHPLLMVNQERVWKKEKEALEERRKLEELKRERDQEREMQALQRLQEEAGGKKRMEKVDWMYATPSAGGGPSANELEDYLLGKKRVDKLLKGDEAQQLSKDAPQQSFMALQSANTSKDLATKIREDPMLAIKRQEQAAYEALLRDPTKLKELRKAHGIDDGEDKEAKRRRKEEKRREKEERRAARHAAPSSSRHSHSHSHSHSSHRHGEQRERSRSRSPRPHRRDEPLYGRSSRRDEEERRRSGAAEEYERRPPPGAEPRSRSPRAAADDYARSGRPRDHHDRDHYSRPRDDYPCRRDEDRRAPHDRPDDRYHSRPGPSSGHSSNSRPPPPAAPTSAGPTAEEERAAKLARMAANAKAVESERSSMLSRVQAEEAAELAREEEAREKAQKRYGKLGSTEARGHFLVDQQRAMTMGSDMDLGERLGRGKAGLQRIAAD